MHTSFHLSIRLSLLCSSASPSIHPVADTQLAVCLCEFVQQHTCKHQFTHGDPLANRYWGCSLINNFFLHIFRGYCRLSVCLSVCMYVSLSVRLSVCLSVSTNLWESSANSDGSPILSTHHITQQLFFFSAFLFYLQHHPFWICNIDF